MSFYHSDIKRKNIKKFIDTEKCVIQAGKTINWKKFTQENNKDLNIYEVLEKYDGKYVNRLKYDPEIEKAEIDHTLTLDKVFDRQEKIKEQFLNLPLEVRKEFNNDINEFTDRGQAWLDEKVKVIQKERKEKEARRRQIEEEAKKQQEENK